MSDACGCPSHREVERGRGSPPCCDLAAQGFQALPPTLLDGRRAARGHGPQQESRHCPDGMLSPVLPREATLDGVWKTDRQHGHAASQTEVRVGVTTAGVSSTTAISVWGWPCPPRTGRLRVCGP